MVAPTTAPPTDDLSTVSGGEEGCYRPPPLAVCAWSSVSAAVAKAAVAAAAAPLLQVHRQQLQGN